MVWNEEEKTEDKWINNSDCKAKWYSYDYESCQPLLSI